MFWVTVSTLPLYTEPLRVHIVDILNAHVVCNLVDLSKYQHNGASIGLELVCCVHWLSTESTCQTYKGEFNILDFPPINTINKLHQIFKMLIFDTGSLKDNLPECIHWEGCLSQKQTAFTSRGCWFTFSSRYRLIWCYYHIRYNVPKCCKYM